MSVWTGFLFDRKVSEAFLKEFSPAFQKGFVPGHEATRADTLASRELFFYGLHEVTVAAGLQVDALEFDLIGVIGISELHFEAIVAQARVSVEHPLAIFHAVGAEAPGAVATVFDNSKLKRDGRNAVELNVVNRLGADGISPHIDS